MSYSIVAARGPQQLDLVRTLFLEYAAALDIDLAFQDFEAELAGLPGRYRATAGELLLALGGGGDALGCVGIRPLAELGTCEVKRLYVRDSGRGQGLGRALAGAAVAFATAAGYRRVVLDTLPSMRAAIALYGELGFEPIPPYGTAQIPGLLYFAKRLHRG